MLLRYLYLYLIDVFLTKQQGRNSFYDSFVTENYSAAWGFFVKQDHSLCFSSVKWSIPHHVIANSGSGQQTAEVKVQVSIKTLHSQIPLEPVEIYSKLMVEPSRQLKFQEPCSSRHKGWDSFAQTQTSIISSGAGKHLSWPPEGTSERLMCSLECICHPLQVSQTAHPVWTCSWTTCFTWLFLSRGIELEDF